MCLLARTKHNTLNCVASWLKDSTGSSSPAVLYSPYQHRSTVRISFLQYQLGLNIKTAPFKKILSLKDPSSKMSKSSPDVQSRILLNDDAHKIKAKIREAVTDSVRGITYDPISRPGTSNLLSILAACTGEQVEVVAKRYETKGHGQLKADVYEALEEMLKGPRTEFEKIRQDIPYLEEVARIGAEKARRKSELTLQEVRTRLGLV
jgi:tryptophanyl-tRNA synthetase